MKRTGQYIIKKPYHKPAIEEVELDRDMSLVMVSEPPVDPGGPGPGIEDAPQQPDYGEQKYEPVSNPFGGSRPAY